MRGSVRIRRTTTATLLRDLQDAGRRGGQPLADLLVRELPVARDELTSAIDRTVVADLEAAGVIEPAGDTYMARCRIDRVDGLLVASDLKRNQHSPDFVVGPAPASFLLARHVRPHARGRLLDLGCGSGFLGLLLGGDRTDTLGLDINPRAVAFTRFNAALNGRKHLRGELGDFLCAAAEPRLDGRFDTVVANPPFVLTPSKALVYRDRPLGGDEVGERTVERMTRALRPDGRGYVLCNWIDRGGAWSDPVHGWLRSAGASGVVARVADLEPVAYAAIWTRGLPAADRPRAVAHWAESLEAEGIRRIHVGVIAVARLAPRRRPKFEAIDQLGQAGSWRPLEAAFAAASFT